MYFLRWMMCAVFAACPLMAHAALYDEIQVYDDSINEPGEFGLETHINATPKGRSTPNYAGEIVPDRGARLTAEFSYGLTEVWEAGLYLPMLMDKDRNFYLAGTKLRLKWIPKKSDPEGGVFYGLNFELAKVGKQFDESTMGFELRPILGYRTKDWMFLTNPVISYPLSPGYRQGGVEFSPSIKISRNIGDGISLGTETYSDLGKLATLSASGDQQHTIYAVIDVDRDPWKFNLGLGYGLSQLSDRWTIKAIFEIPWPFSHH